MAWNKIVPKPIEDRFLPKLILGVAGGHWLWTGSHSTAGYARLAGVGAGAKPLYAHRVAYELFIGPIPDAMQIDHLCRVRGCVNPHHLEPVTSAENGRRGLRGVLTTHCPRGHEYNAENTYRYGNSRQCKTCKKGSVQAKARVVAEARGPRLPKTYCPSGHPYSEGNTLRLKDGSRRCRICNSAHAKKWRDGRKP